MKQTALLVADDQMNGRIANLLLREAGLEVVPLGPGNPALEKVRSHSFDLHVIEAGECRPELIEFCRNLRAETVNPILVLLPGPNDRCALEAYRAGVDDYIPLPLNPALFVAKVRAWLRRAWTVPAEALETVEVKGYRLHPGSRELTVPQHGTVKLTHLECRVLHLLMTHPQQTLAPAFLLDRIWTAREDADPSSLKNLIYRLRRKLEVEARVDLIHTVAGEGYQFHPQ